MLNYKKIGIVLGLVVLVLIAGIFGYKKINSNAKIDKNAYYAVFLTNGQVYFGHLASQTNKEFTMNSVYYLQLENNNENLQGQLDESRFTLIKMGNEIHGPTDELFINRESILFYEKLRDDSKVVDSIKKST